MKRTSRSRRGTATGPPECDFDAQLEDLRRLIVGPEQVRLEVLEARLPFDREAVAAALPEVVGVATQARSSELAVALEPSVKAGLCAVAEKEPEILGSALAPTIGTAVRRAVADAISAMLQRFDAALEQSFSLEGLRWRLEARRTGRPFAEVVLLRTLVYRVEQVFLLHSDTGLVLAHATRPGTGVQDPDQVASLLQALDAFAHEAFRSVAPGAHLRLVDVGDLTLWIERDEKATLAAAVWGVAPRSFGDVLRETRERIVVSHAADLAHFRSDPSPFEAARPLLESCLKCERRPPRRRAHIGLSVLAVAALSGGFFAALEHRRSTVREARLREAYVRALESEPGTVVTSIAAGPGRYRISGLHDPLAREPSSTLARHGLAPAELDFAPFFSLDPRLTAARAERILQPPSQVALAVEEGVLRAQGRAPRAWVERARVLAATLPGISRFDETALGAAEAEAEARRAAERLESIRIRFERGSARLSPEERPRLLRAARWALALVRAAAEARLSVCAELVGHASPDGTPATNEALRARRAERVHSALRGLGIPAAILLWEARAAPSDDVRRTPGVTFEVELSERDSGCEAIR